MTRKTLPVRIAAILGLVLVGATSAVAQQTTGPDPAPQPQMPPMPSMDGEQGDTGKPIASASPHAKRPGPKPGNSATKPAAHGKPHKPVR